MERISCDVEDRSSKPPKEVSRASQTQISDRLQLPIWPKNENKRDAFLEPDLLEQNKERDLAFRLYTSARVTYVPTPQREKENSDAIHNEMLYTSLHPVRPHKDHPTRQFRTLFLKNDHERKLSRMTNKTINRFVTKDFQNKECVSAKKIESEALNSASDEYHGSENDYGSEVTWEPVTARSQMDYRLAIPRSTKTTKQSDLIKVMSKYRDNLYDITEPSDDDVINHIIRLRTVLNWKTMLPRHGPGVRRAMKLTDHKNPLKEQILPLEDAGEFVYAVERSTYLPGKGRRPNPFDLQVVSTERARRRSTYYLITATSVTKVAKSPNNDLHEEITPVIWWIYEQRLFNIICDLSVFENFRIWKQFNLWKSIIRNKKTTSSAAVLRKQLFSADVTLQSCLTAVRSMFEDACGSRDGFGISDSAIILISYNTEHTYTLNEFCDLQNDKCTEAASSLEMLQSNIADMCYRACAAVVEREGITKDVRSGNVPRKRYTTKLTVEEDTGPTFAQLAAWRQSLSRMKQFIKHVDNILLETLHRLVKTAVKCLLAFISCSANFAADDQESDLNVIASLYRKVTNNGDLNGHKSSNHLRRIVTGVEARRVLEPEKRLFRHDAYEGVEETDDSCLSTFSLPRSESIITIDSDENGMKTQEKDGIDEELGTLPRSMFLIRIQLNIGDLPVSRKSSASSRSSRRKANIQRLSAIASTRTLGNPGEDNTPENLHGRRGKRVSFPNFETNSEDDDWKSRTKDDLSDSQSVASSTSRRSSRQIEMKPTVTLSPTKLEFERGIQDLLDTFESIISGVPALLQDPVLFEFTRAPEFDLHLNIDEEAEAMEEETRRPWPDLELLLGGDQEYIKDVEEMVKFLGASVDEVATYSERYERYCKMVEKSKSVDVHALLAEYEWGPDEFSSILAQHTEMLREMHQMEPRRRIGLLHVDTKPFSNACLPFPQSVVNAVHDRLPGIAVHRNEELLRVIRAACRKLDSEPTSVEQFVEHLTFLARLETEMVTLEKEFVIVNRFFAIIHQYSISLNPEDIALYQTLVPTFQHLKSTVLFCQARKDENILKFSADLDQRVHDLRYSLFEIRNKVSSPHLLNVDLLSVVALETIKLLTEEVENLSTKAKSYANYQDRFGSSYSSKGKNIYSV